MNLDLYLFNLINGFAGKWKALDYSAMFCADYLGYVLIVVLIIFLAWNFKKYWRMVLEAMIAAVFTKFILVEIIRHLWVRLRPFVSLNFVPLINQSAEEASFPSGHASFYFALSTIVYLYNKKLGIIFYVASIFIVVSRVFVGVHWPSDILAGAILGILIGWILNKLFKKYESNIFRRWRSI
jgi:undecaprenyl-diphosphatase